MYVYRIHIRPSGGSADIQTSFQYCLENDILGVGWRVDGLIETQEWDKYYEKALSTHGKVNNCKYIHDWVKKGDLAWTRDSNGTYYLARVTSGWEYWTNQKGIELDVDIANIFRCRFHKVDIEEVPGKVVACFRAPRTIQEIADKRARAYSQHLWNKLSNSNIYEVERSEFSDVFMMLDAEETEDLLFLFLQREGWYVVPNSRKGDTMRFEFLVTHSKNYEKAETQVKTGESPIRLEKYAAMSHKVFLFQSNEIYEGACPDNVVCLRREQLSEFLTDNIKLFPRSFQRKLEIVTSG